MYCHYLDIAMIILLYIM